MTEFHFRVNAENLKTIVYVHLCKRQKQGSKSGFQMPWIKKHVNKDINKDKHTGKLMERRLLVGTWVAG